MLINLIEICLLNSRKKNYSHDGILALGSNVIPTLNIINQFSNQWRKKMNRIKLIQGYDPNKTKETLRLVLRQRKNEFRELADALRIPTTSEEWEIIILKFCLDFEECFEIWTGREKIDYPKTFKCMTIMREIAQGGKTVTEIAHIQTTANTIYHEFHNIYKRI